MRGAGHFDIKSGFRCSYWHFASIATALLLLYGCRLVDGEFVSIDDPIYVSRNDNIRVGLSGTAITYALTSVTQNYWHPVTWLSHTLDCELFGMNASGHHLSSILLHAANVALFIPLFVRMTGRYWPSAVTAVFWGLHPLRVESVAWISERKDVLSGFFGLLTLLAYCSYVRAGGRKKYATVLACFALAAMSKPTVVVLPVAMLLMDWWPLKRNSAWLQLVREKIPIFAMSAAVGVITIYGQNAVGAMTFTANVPFALKLENAVVSVGLYLGQVVWPVNLACHYPFPSSIGLGAVLLSGAVIATASVVAWLLRHERPYLLFGWAWFLLWLLPTIGIIQVGRQTGLLFVICFMSFVFYATQCFYQDELLRSAVYQLRLLRSTPVPRRIAAQVVEVRHRYDDKQLNARCVRVVRIQESND